MNTQDLKTFEQILRDNPNSLRYGRNHLYSTAQEEVFRQNMLAARIGITVPNLVRFLSVLSEIDSALGSCDIRDSFAIAFRELWTLEDLSRDTGLDPEMVKACLLTFPGEQANKIQPEALGRTGVEFCIRSAPVEEFDDFARTYAQASGIMDNSHIEREARPVRYHIA